MNRRVSPTTLHARCEVEANEHHARRLAELKTLAPLLARLDELMPELQKRGMPVYPHQLSLWIENDPARGWRARRNVLRISTYSYGNAQARTSWFRAFLELGFKPLSVSDPSLPYPTATLARKHLLVRLDCEKDEAARVAAELRPAKEAA